MHDDGKITTRIVQCPFGTKSGRLRLQQILRRLDQHRVYTASNHAFDLLLIGVTQLRVRDVPERRQLRAGADTTQHPPPAIRRAVGVGRLPCDPRAGLRQLADSSADAVFTESGKVRAEGVGLDRIHSDLEVGIVNRTHDIGSGDVQDLVAALELLEVLQRQIILLQHGAHRPVSDHHAF
jgi:hypothetical protein